ncbi:hypothetical protein VPH35_068544 [Triticum aestivum]
MDLPQRAMLGGSLLPPDCLLDRRVRTDFDDDDENDLIGLQPFKILRCVEKTAVGFTPEMQGYATEVVQSLHLGLHLASGPPGLSFLGLRGGSPLTKVEAVDQGIIVLTTTFLHDFSRIVYLVYDADNGSLHMAPAPEDPSWLFTGLTVRLLIVRPNYGDYTLALLGKLDGEGDALLVWQPSSSSVPPWSKIKAVGVESLIGKSSLQVDCTFSASGMSCWADLLRGVTFCNPGLFTTGLHNKEYILKFGFFPLPQELVEKSKDHRRSNSRVAQPKAYRTMGTTLQTWWRKFPPFYNVRFVSIDGFLEPIDLKDRAVTVWWLCQKGLEWKLEYKISLEALWEFNGFGDLPRNLTPMYPLLSPNDHEIVYFALGEWRENQSNWLFIPTCARYLLAINPQHKTVVASVCLADCFGNPTIPPDIISSDFQRHIHTVSLDLHIMLMETMKQMSLTSLDPAEYDEEEAKKLMKEEPWTWQEKLKEQDRPLPLPLPAWYYRQPSLLRLIGCLLSLHRQCRYHSEAIRLTRCLWSCMA